MEGIGKQYFNTEEEFVRIMNSLPILVRTCTADGQVLFCNTAWENFAVSCQFDSCWSDGMRHDCRYGWQSVYASYVYLKKGFSAKYRLKKTDGSLVWLAEQLVPSFSSDGLLIGFACYAQDIDELITADEPHFVI
jgi:PAS domain-containing protein